MATNSKSKSTNQPGKGPRDTNSNFSGVAKPVQKKRPTEEQIRQKAQEIYNQRLRKGEHGTELGDWQKAEQILTES
jgi:hypothetical protein